MDVENIRRVLYRKREEKGLSAQKFGEMVGVAKTTIYRYEKGQIEKMPFTVVNQLADILEINPAFIAGFSDDPEIPTMNETMIVSRVANLLHELEPLRQRNVYVYTMSQVQEQKKESANKKKEIYTLAAHSKDKSKKATKEDLDNINSVLDELDAKHERNNKNKRV